MNFFLFLSFGLFLFRDFFPSYAFPSSQMCFMHFLFLEELFYLHFNFSLIFSVALFGLFPPPCSLQDSRVVLHMEGVFD